MSKYRRKAHNLRASIKFLALVGVLAGAAMVQAQQPLSPWTNVVDLAGNYLAPSPGVQADGLARVNTLPSADNVTEISNGVPAQENTFTPYSDAFKKPIPLALDIRGHSVSTDISLGDPAKWQYSSANMSFVVGVGHGFGSANPVDGVIVEARYYWVLPNEPHAQFRLRTAVATGNWIDAGPYGSKQVQGAYTVRIDVDASGIQATMVVTPKPTLVPPPTDWYQDWSDTQPASITAALPFEAGFWTSGQPNTARAGARIIRMVTNAGDMTMWLKAVDPFITSDYGRSQGATAPVTTEFHLGMSNLEDLSRGYQASGIYYGSVWGYFISPMIMDSTAILDQSWLNPVAGPFQYLKSPYVFNFTLYNDLNPGPYGFANFRISAASAPGTPSLNTDAELAGLPVGPIIPNYLGESGGQVWVQLTQNDPEGILGVTGCAYQNGQVYPADVSGSDTVIVDEIRPVAGVDGGYVKQGSTNLIPPSGPNVIATQGNIDVKFRAVDFGNYNAATGSGLADLPQAIIERLVGQDWVAYQPLTIYPESDNMFVGRFVVNNQTPCATYRVRFIAQDRVGLYNAPSVTRPFDVKTLLSVTVNLSLQGLDGNPNANNQRLIRFMFGSQQGTVVPPGGSTAPPTIIDKLVRFANGRATLTFSEPDIPHCDANNLMVWVKDLQHTLGTATAPQNGIVGGNYTFTLGLRAGDVNNDNVVNFTDYALFIADYGKNAPRDMTSMSWYRNCDLNGNGQVDFVDWSLFYPNYGLVGDQQPGQYVRAFGAQKQGGDVDASAPGLNRMPVKQLIKLGVSNAATWDLNHDGWVDKSELDKALQAKMHGPKPGAR